MANLRPHPDDSPKDGRGRGAKATRDGVYASDKSNPNFTPNANENENSHSASRLDA